MAVQAPTPKPTVNSGHTPIAKSLHAACVILLGAPGGNPKPGNGFEGLLAQQPAHQIPVLGAGTCVADDAGLLRPLAAIGDHSIRHKPGLGSPGNDVIAVHRVVVESQRSHHYLLAARSSRRGSGYRNKSYRLIPNLVRHISRAAVPERDQPPTLKLKRLHQF